MLAAVKIKYCMSSPVAWCSPKHTFRVTNRRKAAKKGSISTIEASYLPLTKALGNSGMDETYIVVCGAHNPTERDLRLTHLFE